MCYSILRVTFKNDKSKQVSECSSEADERTKIAEYQDKDQVSKIAVFRCQRHVERIEKWEEKPYSPPLPDSSS